MSAPSSNPDLDRVKAACNSLIEHFDTVQIFATRCESGELDGTVNVQWGAGNWFARSGQVHAWLLKNNEDERETRRRRDEL